MTKHAAKNAPTTDFENLVRNGIDFLEKAMSQLDSDPKHSVINFYTAVEIFLKAPLVLDHWSLVIAGREPDRQKYDSGDFVSVSFEEACSLLSRTLKKPLQKSARDAFDKVRQHRNRMVHFYHSGLNGKQRNEIKLEQATAWFELNRFVADTWREEFKPFTNEFQQMERTLIANNHYAKAKYEDLKPKIEGMKKGGATFEDCPRCHTNAYQAEEDAPRLTSHHCMVCFNNEKQLQLDCPDCGDADQYMEPYDGFSCTECDCEVSGESEIFELLDQNSFRGTKDDLDADTPANCDECQGYHTVCEYEGGYLCTNCFAYFNAVGQCQWCNDPMTGDTAHTYVTGCEHCDGYAGHHAND
ncbi:MAG: hypothetical protein Q8S96_14615 [Hydrogenophaga sp.]|uniref:hypothetical protein n=1 Tax=Hydrogenophaga sp. TaxID=1904254 RepID=UPI0027161F28|nr:hypothetical protein [Hydrogenophaga sp.]MDO9480984.1 hypothetical protein [Hydrogenophaga sp.]MDP3345667.1 hypothetical protein [Hydrogenophaga sp.]MDP3809044.1 hypothetical protein [Hydrogenophaga sp.]MDP3924670.1 hypothetical protein [Hydrogenophaga sp.]